MGDFARYLAAKRGVDDRALNGRVWRRLANELKSAGDEPVRVVDAGAGIGTGAERIAEWRLLEPLSRVRYLGIEPREELLGEASSRLASLPFPAEIAGGTLEAFASRSENRGRFDLAIAHALLDVVDLSPALDALFTLVRPEGLLYIPITFDGETIFEPAAEDDEEVLGAYHDTMEERGSSRTGRRLFHRLRALGAEVLEVGSSDWIVHADGDAYPRDEAFFLGFLLSTIEGAVAGRVGKKALDRWVSERRRQIQSAELFYVAHQLDVLARKPS